MYRDKPSREELHKIAEHDIERLIDLIEMLYDHNNYAYDQINQLAARIDYLEKQLAKDSGKFQ